MAEIFRSKIFAAVEETTAGEYIDPIASNFIPMRTGASMSFGVETIDSDELINSIGMAKSYVSKESPTGTFPKYARHSAIEGTEPEFGILIESAMGAKNIVGTERTTASSSTAGTRSAPATIKVSDGTQFLVGQALLIKDIASGHKYSIRNVDSISTNDLLMNFNLDDAPSSSGLGLGKAIHYYGADTDHPSFTAHEYQAQTGSAFHQAISGCKTTAMEWTFNANEFAEVSFEYAGSKSYLNPITIEATNKYIDFNDGTLGVCEVTEKTYQTPHALAEEIETVLNAAATTLTFTCYYDDTTGKFTISAGGTFSLLFATGTNAANSIATSISYTATDKTSAATYTGTVALVYDSPVTPTYQSADNILCKDAELMIGAWYRNDCLKFIEASFKFATPTVEVQNACAANGIEEVLTSSRDVVLSAKFLLAAHEVSLFSKMINNTSTKAMLNVGSKTGGNWDAGKCINIFLQNCIVSGTTISENDSVVVYEVECKGHVTASQKDVHINFL